MRHLFPIWNQFPKCSQLCGKALRNGDQREAGVLRISRLWLPGPFRGASWWGWRPLLKMHPHVHTNASSSKPRSSKGPNFAFFCHMSLLYHNGVRFTILVNLFTFNTRKSFQGCTSLYSVILRQSQHSIQITHKLRRVRNIISKHISC